MTRARGPAAHEPDEAGGSRAPAAWSEAPTESFRAITAPAAARPAPALPEVPAIADIAAPGRPAVDAVVAPAGPPARGRPRPSRHMRARADEMARLLARAAPAGQSRRLSSLPAAAAVLGAVAVGGVGIALGIDAQSAGQQLALPATPAIPADRTPVPETGSSGTVPTLDTGVVDALATPAVGVAPAEGARPPAAAAAPRTAPAAPPRATTSRSRPTASSTPRSTTPRTATPSSTPRSTTTPTPTPRGGDDTPGGTAAGSRAPAGLGGAGTPAEPRGEDGTTAD